MIFVPAAWAQISAGFKLTESTFNAGGHPSQGTRLTSTSYRITLDAIGDLVTGPMLASASYHASSSFVGGYPPPRALENLRFTSKIAMFWNPDPSVGVYHLYRNTIAALPGDFGSCYQSELGSPGATDPARPASGTSWFYIATARNRLLEEGSKGTRSNGVERTNLVPCP